MISVDWNYYFELPGYTSTEFNKWIVQQYLFRAQVETLKLANVNLRPTCLSVCVYDMIRIAVPKNIFHQMIDDDPNLL